MSDHHIDAMDIDHSKTAEMILKRHGLYISDAPPINHKPGNDFISDVYYPFPNYPDDRFRNPYEEDKDIKYPPEPPAKDDNPKREFEKDFQLVSEEIKALKGRANPLITFRDFDRNHFINGTKNPKYTGLVLQAAAKLAYDISIVKPYFENGERKNKMLVKEIVTGHFYSMALYDGWKYHIFRGKLHDIVVLTDYKKNKLKVSSMPYGSPVEEKVENIRNSKSVVENCMWLIMDVSTTTHGDLVALPLTQLIDIEHYDWVYDFTIYEGDLKVYWKDWFTEEDENNPGTAYTYRPAGDILPQTLYHEVIEHQFPRGYEKE